jgi:hypothetical protein
MPLSKRATEDCSKWNVALGKYGNATSGSEIGMSVLPFNHPRKLTQREISEAVQRIMASLRNMSDAKPEK